MDIKRAWSVAAIQEKFEALEPVMDERMRRLWAAAEARAIGRGGISQVCEATGLTKKTVIAGVRELESGPDALVQDIVHVRRRGGGRPPLKQKDPGLVRELERLVEPTTRGDPQSPLRWTCKSLRRLAAELTRRGHPVSAPKVGELLHEAGYSLQANRKTQEGKGHPDRDRQFQRINEHVKDFHCRRQPVISVDTKKKELVGNFKNGGREWRPAGQPAEVKVHDFLDPKLGKVIPYGVYDVAANAGWVSVGTDHDTPEFAVETIRRWWRKMGSAAYPQATDLLIVADAGGSNGYRSRNWKLRLQRLADDTGLRVAVNHFPPGTSKWNKIEHRMFCHITENWRGKPLVSHNVVVSLIGATTTKAGLRIRAALDPARYPTGIKVTDKDLADVALKRERFHGDWNYSITSRR